MNQQVITNFQKRHYPEIMKEIVEVLDETGLTRLDLLLELDFMLHAGRTAPTLRKTHPNLRLENFVITLKEQGPRSLSVFITMKMIMHMIRI